MLCCLGKVAAQSLGAAGVVLDSRAYTYVPPKDDDEYEYDSYDTYPYPYGPSFFEEY